MPRTVSTGSVFMIFDHEEKVPNSCGGVLAVTHNGYLVISDITGYTGFLNQSEVEYAQDNLSTLPDLL